ncbi:hypothetical protein NliqN6_6326 [Naganishia liquefaciens]|uniref:Uncharacterized protein n=1 Tax=Naganishia liquefaciens TaxID=104408 RepID=A0A8H3TZF6_9TREE|nr:hypothetical protein NliqN6_6326 [Naganishia liquefaciens]
MVPSGVTPSENDDEFTDVEDVLPPSPTLPGQQTPTAHTDAINATPRASTSSVFGDGVRRYAWPIKEDASGGIRRPRFVAKTSFQEVRYRRNHGQRSDIKGNETRDGVHTKGMAPRPIDFAASPKGARGQRETSRLGSAANINRYSLLQSSAHVEKERSPGVPTKIVDFGTTSFGKTISPPLLVRKATYSSLPPSPSALSNVDFEVDVTAPRSVTEGPSYLETYDQLDQDAFTQALQKVLESKQQDADYDRRTIADRTLRATSLPPEDVAMERADPEFRPEIERTPSDHFVRTPPPLSRTASRIRTDAAQALDDDVVGPDGGSSSRPGKRTLQPLWQMITDEMNVEQNRLFVIEGKWERISNFLAVPAAIEKITLFGCLACLDAFLYNFTILPLKAIFATAMLMWDMTKVRQLGVPASISLSPILRSLLVIIPTVVLSMTTDVSKMYHKVRGQDTIKLYVIYNALEIADKLCSAFGQDILDTLFSKETLEAAWWSEPSGKQKRRRKRERATPFFFFMLGLAYVHIHALVYFYQLVSLNVAVNSYDNALLTLLVSNQFVEIKGSVFKKFEKENLLQIMCADIVERFQLGLMLSVIAVRNMIEMSGSDLAFLPKSFVRGKSLLDTILSPVLIVILSEMAVDWLKHAFITKFNHIRASVYDRYLDVLCKDVMLAGRTRQSVSTKTRNVLTDHTLLLGRRLGFASLPLSCLLLRVGVQAIGMISLFSSSDEDGLPPSRAVQVFSWVGVPCIAFLVWLSLISLKVLLGTVLSTFAIQRQSGMTSREQADQVNSFGRNPIAENAQEDAYNQEVKTHLSNVKDDIPPYDPVMSGKSGVATEKKSSKPKWALEEVERWTMVKRIF